MKAQKQGDRDRKYVKVYYYRSGTAARTLARAGKYKIITC